MPRMDAGTDQKRPEIEPEIMCSTSLDDIHVGHAKEKLNLYNYMVVVAVSCGALAVGMVNGMISTTLGQPSFLEYFGFMQFTATKRPLTGNTPLIGAILGVFFAAALFGAAFGAYACDKFGRKKALMIGAIIATCSSGLVAGSVHIAMLLVFRAFSGFGSGMLGVVTSLYQSELAPPHYRGLMVGLSGAMIAMGYLLANWIGVIFYFVNAGGAQWRVPFALCILPSILVLCLFPVIPESPRYLMMNDKVEEARAVLLRLHGRDRETHNFVELEIKQMVAQIGYEGQSKVTWREFLFSRQFRKRLILTFVTQTMSQSAGMAVVVSYGPAIYASLGFTTVGQLCITAGYVTWGCLCGFVGTLLVDRLGRVKMMKIGVVMQILLIGVVTALVAVYAGGTNKAANAAAVVIIYIFEAGYTLFLEGPTYTYVSEMWPVHLRAKGCALGVASIYLINIVYVEASLYAFATIGWKYYLVFICAGSFFLVIFWTLAPETRGLTLEEMAMLFGDPIKIDAMEYLKTANEMIPLHGGLSVRREDIHVT